MATAQVHGDAKGEYQLGQAIANRRVLVLAGDGEGSCCLRATALT